MSIQQGQIYKIGVHTVGCGDCTDQDFVSSVIGDSILNAIVSDPPYGVAYVENKQGVAKLAKKDAKAIQGDHLQTEAEYVTFTVAWLSILSKHLAPYNTFHIFNCDLMFLALREGIQDSGFRFSQMVTWLKNKPVMGRMDYLPQHELIAYGWFGKHKRPAAQMPGALYYPRPQRSKMHPTQKPLGLLRKIIVNTTSVNDVVYDGFLGSGSTAIACAQVGRRSIGIEQDPEYVETILKRLEKVTRTKRELQPAYEQET